MQWQKKQFCVRRKVSNIMLGGNFIRICLPFPDKKTLFNSLAKVLTLF